MTIDDDAVEAALRGEQKAKREAERIPRRLTFAEQMRITEVFIDELGWEGRPLHIGAPALHGERYTVEVAEPAKWDPFAPSDETPMMMRSVAVRWGLAVYMLRGSFGARLPDPHTGLYSTTETNPQGPKTDASKFWWLFDGVVVIEVDRERMLSDWEWSPERVAATVAIARRQRDLSTRDPCSWCSATGFVGTNLCQECRGAGRARVE